MAAVADFRDLAARIQRSAVRHPPHSPAGQRSARHVPRVPGGVPYTARSFIALTRPRLLLMAQCRGPGSAGSLQELDEEPTYRWGGRLSEDDP
jgi:hypothetical protein